MKVVIDIDDNLYTRLFDNGDIDAMDMLKACVAIRKGTPLPKGHGKIVDVDTIDLNQDEFISQSDYCAAECAIENAPTIIEADNAESDDIEALLEHLWNATVEDMKKE
jgi:hypothetical protein